MICDHCNDGDDPNCLNCDGSGTICDHCGEAADRGAALCPDCHQDTQDIILHDHNDDSPDPLPHHMRIVDEDEHTHAQD